MKIIGKCLEPPPPPFWQLPCH